MKNILFLFMCNIFVWSVYAQKATPFINPGVSSYYDTVIVRSGSLFVLHYYEVSKERSKQMIFSNEKDIFNDSINKFSRIIISNGMETINLPTIPLENIIILDDKEVIIGLTRIQASPYLVVIYDFEGKLLYKGNLGVLTLKLDKKKLKQLAAKYPPLLNYSEKENCIQEGDTFFVELSREMLNNIGRDSIRANFMKGLIFGHYLPYDIVADQGGVYSHYENLYRYSDPLSDLIMIGTMPYLLILNEENGNRVSIPLVSNCNIRQEVQDWDE